MVVPGSQGEQGGCQLERTIDGQDALRRREAHPTGPRDRFPRLRGLTVGARGYPAAVCPSQRARTDGVLVPSSPVPGEAGVLTHAAAVLTPVKSE